MLTNKANMRLTFWRSLWYNVHAERGEYVKTTIRIKLIPDS